MFKSKIDFNSFDKRNTRVKDLKYIAVKGLVKKGAKKLEDKIGERTFFHLILDYYVGPDGKSLGHFLDFGINKILRRHFIQVEMKSGKLEKSMSTTPKKACAGAVYIKELKGTKVIYFEPIDASKIPKGQWPKILKDLKPFLNGLKAFVVLKGEVIGAEKENKDKSTPTEPSTEPTAVDGTPTDVDSKLLATKIKELVLGITGILKEKLPKEIVPKIKAKNVSKEDADIANDLFSKLDELKKVYESAGSDIQQKIKTHYDSIMSQVPKLKKVKTAIDKLLSILEKPNDLEEIKQLKELLATVIKEKAGIWANFNETKDEILTASSQAIEGGDQLIKALYN